MIRAVSYWATDDSKSESDRSTTESASTVLNKNPENTSNPRMINFIVATQGKKNQQWKRILFWRYANTKTIRARQLKAKWPARLDSRVDRLAPQISTHLLLVYTQYTIWILYSMRQCAYVFRAAVLYLAISNWPIRQSLWFVVGHTRKRSRQENENGFFFRHCTRINSVTAWTTPIIVYGNRTEQNLFCGNLEQLTDNK